MTARLNALWIFLLLCSVVNAQQYATIDYGIQVPVAAWKGDSSLVDFAVREAAQPNVQGKLILLGHTANEVWYIEAYSDNDAADDIFTITLLKTDTNSKTKSWLLYDMQKDTGNIMKLTRRRFLHFFSASHLTPIPQQEVWINTAVQSSYIAEVNDLHLKKCFTWNFNLQHQEGTCAFFFDWSVDVSANEKTRIVGIFNFLLEIPAAWKYFPGDSSVVMVAGTDTILFSKHNDLLDSLAEEDEAPMDDQRDSIEFLQFNLGVRHYNGDLRKTYPFAKTHIISEMKMRRCHFIFCYPIGNIAGNVYLVYFEENKHGNDFIMKTGRVSTARQTEIKHVLDSLVPVQ